MALPVHIWSDIACPWCYVGKKRLEQAARKIGADLEIEWHSFQLDPRPIDPTDAREYAQRLADKYGFPLSQAEMMIRQMTTTGKAEGIDFDFDVAIPANTSNAHRLLHWAKSQSLEAQNALKEALLVGYFSRGRDLNQSADLLSVVSDVGLNVDEASGVLESDTFADEVRADMDGARQLGVTGVPFFVIGNYGVGGAQPVETFVNVLEKAEADAQKELDAEKAATSQTQEGAMCGPEGCEI